MKDIDMDLEKADQVAEAQADFHSEDTPNIWALSDSEEEADKKDQAAEDTKLEEPSFLRRFRRRPSHDEMKETAEGESGTGDSDNAGASKGKK